MRIEPVLTSSGSGGVVKRLTTGKTSTGTIIVIWLGRRTIAGVNPGRSIEISGRIGRHDGQRIMYNPRYELMP